MSNLREAQEKFGEMLLGDNADPARPLLVPYDELEGFGAEARLAVYRNNVISSLTEALAASFPALHRLVGEGFFAYLSVEFIKAHPPKQARLSVYGAELPDFLEKFPGASDHPYLPDVARLEYFWLQAYHAPGPVPLKLQELQKLSPDDFETLRLDLHLSRYFMVSEYPVAAIWEANRADEDNKEEQNISLDQGGDHILIIRPRLEVEVRTLTPAAYALLKALDEGRTLVAAYEAAAEVDRAFDLQSTLQQLFAGETFTAYHL